MIPVGYISIRLWVYTESKDVDDEDYLKQFIIEPKKPIIKNNQNLPMYKNLV